ncbi:universal stress protein [Aliishimia ponticola]|uniref:Universal stress protein n=1 Tax=Aliishimia ponticola TaxID=2499833 RepID=A0A4S4NL54_9RHOB|nr:universal stress protein [Aliishimia ponticola]THH36890.1 universal stress protein [Aliishimia ponticola]
MKNGTILIAVGQDAAMDTLAAKLETIRAIPAKVAILLVGEVPEFPYYAASIPPYGGSVIPPEWQEAVVKNNAALKAKQDEIETLLQQHDVAGGVSVISTEPSRIADAIARRAMLCDVAMVSDDLRDPGTLFRQVVYGVLFQSPIGVLLNDTDATALQQPKRIFVAWNTHLHTARAVHQALPLLRQAEQVTIGTIDPVMSEYYEGEDPGVDVAGWLTHHGCNVTVQQYTSGGNEIGQCILDRSKEAGADLIVMGSYSHSRTREALFGGTTRTLMEQTEQPVFLAH